MRLFFLIALAFVTTGLFGQGEEAKLTMTIKEFHQSLVNKNMTSIDQHTDKALSYGHSNGWVETKTDLVKDLETGYLTYQSFKEDSITVSMNGTMANVRFLADVTVNMKGTSSSFHLKVLEVWVKKSNRWVLFARQAVKVP